MNLTEESFQKEIDSNDVIIIDFWADWCNPCKKVSPILDEISSEYNVMLGKINIDDFPKVAEKYDVFSIPTMIVFEKGVPVKTVIGAQPKHKLVQEFEGWL